MHVALYILTNKLQHREQHCYLSNLYSLLFKIPEFMFYDRDGQNLHTKQLTFKFAADI